MKKVFILPAGIDLEEFETLLKHQIHGSVSLYISPTSGATKTGEDVVAIVKGYREFQSDPIFSDEGFDPESIFDRIEKAPVTNVILVSDACSKRLPLFALTSKGFKNETAAGENSIPCFVWEEKQIIFFAPIEGVKKRARVHA